MISFKFLQASPKWRGKEVHWGLCRCVCVLGAAKGLGVPVLLLPAVHRLGGKHQCPGQVFSGDHEAWGRKSPRCCSVSLGAGVQASLVPMFAAGQQGGKARLILALSQLCLFPLSPHWERKNINLARAVNTIPGSLLATEIVAAFPYPKLSRCPQSSRTWSYVSFSAEMKSIFLLVGGGLVSPQVVPVKASTALL